MEGNIKMNDDEDFAVKSLATAFQFGMALGFAEKCGECNDCISRQAVLKLQYRIDDSSTFSTRDVVNVEDIEDLPGVTPKEKTGYWIDKDIRGRIEPYCSVCGDSVDTIYHYAYCPNCGAKMVEQQESEDRE